MSCCSPSTIDGQFGEGIAKGDLKRYRKKGPDWTSRILIDAIRQEGDWGDASLLDIGGGIGVIAHELLGEGVAMATYVEAASAYFNEARAESERRGHGERISFVHGDFVDVADEVSEADIVTLDRVICCYPDMESLVVASAAKCRRLYGLSFPRERWFVKAAMAILNTARRLLGNPFRTYVHPTKEIERRLVEAGLRRSFSKAGFVMQVALYSR